RQPWAEDIGWVGNSYPGNSQLLVAATHLPSLRAIMRGHVVINFCPDEVYPGSIQNKADAGIWAHRQVAIAADAIGYEWVQERIGQGDEICEQNQAQRHLNAPLLAQLQGNPFDGPFWAERAAWNFVDRIQVPTLLVNSWQDDTTGGRPAVLLE